MANKDTVKPWFVTGAYPTQAQFWQLFEWLRWRDEVLNIADISGLQSILNGIATLQSLKSLFRDELNITSNSTWSCDQGIVITGIILKSDVNATINIGTTNGGTEITEIELEAGNAVAVSLIFYAQLQTTIYFTGIGDTTKIIILKNPA